MIVVTSTGVLASAESGDQGPLPVAEPGGARAPRALGRRDLSGVGVWRPGSQEPTPKPFNPVRSRAHPWCLTTKRPNQS